MTLSKDDYMHNTNTNVNPEVPRYVIYCDESCHELTPHHSYMSIGGLKVHQARKQELSRKFGRLRQSCELNAEVKWSKTSEKRLQDYKKLVDFFFDNELQFRAIVVEQARVRVQEYHGKDRELAFYKFYYEMLEKWLELEAGSEYLILLDYKNNRGADRYTTLKTYLERHLRGKAWIRDLTTIVSKQTPLAQLCDILTGSVAAANNGFLPNSAKENLAKYITSRAGLATLCESTPLTVSKFNIFKMDLR
jgi:hypothetical protein